MVPLEGRYFVLVQVNLPAVELDVPSFASWPIERLRDLIQHSVGLRKEITGADQTTHKSGKHQVYQVE